MGYLPQIGRTASWTWIFIGAGLYSLLGSLYRLSSESFSNPPAFDYIWGGILLLIGLNGLTVIKISWPLVLVPIGAVLLFVFLTRKER